MTGTARSGRNSPCPCGSGRKYKACCGQLARDVRAAAAAPLSQDVPPHELQQLRELLESGRYQEAERRARALVDAWPQSGLLWQMLGVALGRQGKEAVEAWARAVRCSPDDPVAHLNLGNSLRGMGRLLEAAASYERALQLAPGFAEAHGNLGDLLLELGRIEEAAAACRRSIGIQPGRAEAHQILGKVLLSSGDHAGAAASCRQAIRVRHDFAEAHNSLGNALMKLARTEEAMASFRTALGIKPDFVEAHANLARALRSVGRLDEAVACYRRALELRPDFVAVCTELATALRLQRRTAEAEAACREALRLDPGSAPTLEVLAELRADAGRFAEAEDLFRSALALDPQSSEAWAGITRVRRMSPADVEWLAAAQRLLKRGLPPLRERSLRHAIGKYFDDVHDYENAFANYRLANELGKRWGPGHDRSRLSQSIDLLIRCHDREWLGRARPTANPSTRPVFIVGMLRSGTTLAEQILASHPQVHGAGELTYWSTELAAALAGNTPQIQLSDTGLARLGEDFLALLQRLAPHAVRVVDKLPTNFLSLGLIHAALPNARIIHLRRNPVDTCLSIYFQHLEAANTYANDLEDLAHYYREYRRLMHHWSTVLPADSVLDVPYEGLVGDLEQWARRMLDFLALPWNPRCLDFQDTARSVVTASKWQVRQQIDARSVERWRHYERFLAPLLPLLQAGPD